MNKQRKNSTLPDTYVSGQIYAAMMEDTCDSGLYSASSSPTHRADLNNCEWSASSHRNPGFFQYWHRADRRSLPKKFQTCKLE